MDKASGVYLSLTDNSIVSSGLSQLVCLIPMLTTKGKIGINMVTAETMEDVVGYDVDYNPNYYGLKSILENVSYAKVWRLNQGATLANAYVKGNTKSSAEGLTNFDSITSSGVSDVAFAMLNPGDSGKYAVKLSPVPNITSVVNTAPTPSTPQVITFDKSEINENETITVKSYADDSDVEIMSGIEFYNSSNNEFIGALRKDPDDEDKIKVYQLVDGAINLDATYGSAVLNDDKWEITLTKKLSSDTFYVCRTIPESIKNWTLIVGKEGKSAGVYVTESETVFSTDSESDDYYRNINFEKKGIQFCINAIPSASNSVVRNWVSLDNGSNGVEGTAISAVDIDTSVLDSCGCNVILMNGLGAFAGGTKIINRIGAKLDKLKIHMFVDAPEYPHYAEVSEWKSKVMNSKYIAVGARPDQVEKSDGSTIYVYPSVYYGYILANMMSNYQNLNYPPAGLTYGSVPASDLIECDYELFADELKTNRINWIRTQNNGTSMWEQRTTYGLDSDLSYIAPVFIVDSICDRIVSFERNYNFRYITASDLLTQQSGITAILRDFEERNFIYSWNLKVPSYAEAQAAGRTVKIKVEIAVTKDAEVIEIGVVLNA